jgi:pilus assembly protein CpaB
MSGRTLILLLVAMLVAGATVLIVKNRAQPQAQAGSKVLVATTPIEAGSFVHADKSLTWADWPQGDVSPSFITPDIHKIDEFNGAIARRDILPGEPITILSIVRANEGGFMSAVLGQGMRAVSIAVNSTSGNAGFVFPGDKVDLILTHRIPVRDGGGDVLASETFVENVRVLAIDQMLNNPDNKAVIAKTITLEVLPKQAEMINVAANLGAISVSLRSLANGKKPDEKAASPIAVTVIGNPVVRDGVVAPVIPEAIVPQAPEVNYTTDNDVSKLMGNKSAVHAKVNVYHGSTNEQIDFHQGPK